MYGNLYSCVFYFYFFSTNTHTRKNITVVGHKLQKIFFLFFVQFGKIPAWFTGFSRNPWPAEIWNVF